ncbi:MAG: hypothetical protein KF718_04025 [Polyangiaceae bacterium]|nr:hypothetical protein [Polyangiaceae bacterium]
MIRGARLAVVGLFLSLWAPSALADLAPEPGYVESCSVARHQVGGASCVACGASFEDTEACEKEHQPRGYAKRCQTSGASVWTEVWCRGGDPSAVPQGEPASPAGPAGAPEKSGSCGACAVGQPASDPLPLALLLAFGAVVVLRPRLRHLTSPRRDTPV